MGVAEKQLLPVSLDYGVTANYTTLKSLKSDSTTAFATKKFDVS